MPLPTPGEIAPDFELPTDAGGILRLSNLRGSPVVLWFFPRADTPGCTIEITGLRDESSAIDATGAVVVGISDDGVAALHDWKRRTGYPYILASDPGHSVIEAYGQWTEHPWPPGETSMMAARTTLIIDAEGVVTHVRQNVKPADHARGVVAALTT